MTGKNYFWTICFSFVACIQALRLVLMAYEYGTNVLFADQWDFYDPLFNRAPNDWYHLFFTQHGHGEGLGIVLESICNDWSHWDTREEGFFVCGLFILTFLVYAVIRWQFGPLTWFDLIWPVLCLTPLHYEGILITLHPGYGPVPALLVAATAYTMLRRSTWLRDGALVVLYFLTIFTGYGFLTAGFLPLLFASEIFFSLRDRDYALIARKIGGIVFTFLILAKFIAISPLFQDHAIGQDYPLTWGYLQFALQLYAHEAGLNNPVFFLLHDEYHTPILGFLILACTLYVIFVEFKRFICQRDPLAFVLFYLASFSLIYVCMNSIERLSFGLWMAYSSRYVAYMLPGMFALYLFLVVRVRLGSFKTGLEVGVIILCLQGGLFLGEGDADCMTGYQANKREWVKTYLRTGNIAETDKIVHFSLYPMPEPASMEDKMQFLRERHLNLFKDSP